MLRKRLLIIEDEHRAAAQLIVMLNDHGYEVACAADAEAGLLLLQDFRVEVVVASICEFDGFALLDYLYPFLNRARIPIILLSDMPSWQGYSEAINKGAFDYLAQPVNNVELLRTIGRAMARTQSVHAEASLGLTRAPEASSSKLSQ
jgi:DNA-binding response OmpR family regulator